MKTYTNWLLTINLALKMMLNQACLPGSPLKGPEFTMEYLQKRGPEHIDLIFEYATWVLKEYPNDALRVSSYANNTTI